LKRLATLSLIVVHLVVVTISQAIHLVRSSPDTAIEFSNVVWLLTYATIIILFSYGLGFPEMSNSSLRVRNALLVCLAAPTSFAAVQFVTGANRIPRLTFLVSIPLIAVTNYALSIAISKTSVRSSARQPVLVIASQEDSHRLLEDQQKHSEVDFRVIHSIDPSASDPIGQIMLHLDSAAGVIVVEDALLSDEDFTEKIFQLHLQGLRVRSMSQFYEEFLGKVSLKHLSSAALLSDIRQGHDRFYRLVTRFVDLSVASVGLILLVPVTVLVWTGNKIGNKGSLFFRQTRVGFENIPFEIIKFRTMKEGLSNTEWTQLGDDRITRFGRLLRTTHIDELPQCLNILRGDISLVGPRPEQVHYVEYLATNLPFYDVRHRVTPGLTGWAQVNYPYGASESDAFQKLQFEIWYIKQQSISLNLKIMIRTVRHLLRRGGR
jgi:lipopolysaccharide/colanic/teichoic acid biosynthesis glycosyltransferase